MKKFLKFLCGAASVAAAGFGVYCIYKNVIAKKDEDDFDDFDDCFDDDSSESAEENREYVSINITEEDAQAADSEDNAAEEETANTDDAE